MTVSIPQTMTVMEIREPGEPSVLQPGIRSVPRPGAREILVKVEAAGVNYPDVMQRKGRYPPPPGVTDIPGLELAGTVMEVGTGSEIFGIGDKVCALVAGGAYAEYCVVPVPQALPVPASFDMITAAALPETFFTAWTNLFDSGQLQTGESVLIHGGSGGIGTAAIQLARAFGATVFATARNTEKCRVCEELGASRAINYVTEDFVRVIDDETDGAGCNVILDMVGGDYLARNLEALAPLGRLVQIAVLKGAKVELFLPTIMMKQLVLTGSVLRPRTVEQKGAIARSLHEHVWPLLESGQITPIIHETVPLSEAASAHALMESSAHIGKIILRVG